jgi:hypothetical protein
MPLPLHCYCCNVASASKGDVDATQVEVEASAETIVAESLPLNGCRRKIAQAGKAQAAVSGRWSKNEKMG